MTNPSQEDDREQQRSEVRRTRRRRSRPLYRQAAEGIGMVVLLALGALATGLVLSVAVAWLFP